MKKSFLFTVLLSLAFLSASIPGFAIESKEAAEFYNKGIDLYEANKIEDSIINFKKAISLDPNFYEAYYNLARIQQSANKTQDAISSYEKLLKIKPDDWESTFEFGEFLYKKGYLSKSVSYLDRIPEGDEYKSKATALVAKIKVRQSELAEEARVKAEQNLRTTVVGNIPAPSGLVIDSKGNMYVASFSESKIIKISKDGLTKSIFADSTKGISGPIGIAIDSCDNIYVANYTKGNIVLLDRNGKERVLMLAKKPYCISLNEKQAKIYITEQQNNSIISYDITEILKNSKETPKEKSAEKPEKKVITVPVSDKNPLGTPSIQEAPFTKGDPVTSITAPIMVPSENIFE